MNAPIPPSAHVSFHSLGDTDGRSVTSSSNDGTATHLQSKPQDMVKKPRSTDNRANAQLKINNATKRLISMHFGSISNQKFINELLDLFAKTTPFVIKVHRTHTLVHPLQGYAVSENLPRMLEYLSITKNYNLLSDMMEVHEINEQQAQQYLQGLKKLGGHQIGISVMLWQVYQTVLSEEIAYNGHQLSLKLKYMPNLAQLGEMDASVGRIFATCLSSPKTVTQLKDFFPNISKNRLNTVMFLSILSKMADFSVITSQVTAQTVKRNSSPATPSSAMAQTINYQERQGSNQSNKQHNSDVSRAKKSGFFQRLLSKLSW